jgi:GGDEF domain-containing protein
MENTRRHIIVGYAVFTLLFLSGIFVFTLFRIELLSMDNGKRVDAALKELRYQLEIQFSLKSNFSEPEMSGLFDKALSGEPRLLVVAALSDEGIIRAKGVSREYVVNADLGRSLDRIEYKKPLGTSVKEMDLTLKYKDVQLPGRTRLSALYISFSKKDSGMLLEEILFILLGFFGLTLIMILVTAVIARREEATLRRALTPDTPLNLPDLPPTPSPRPVPAAPVQPPGTDGLKGLEWSEEEREARRRERYSEETGLVKRGFFQDRLAAEIERAVSFGEDMALFLISAGVEQPDAWKVHLVPVIHRLFGDPDLAHEYGPDTAAVIAPGMDMDTAIKTARLFYKQVLERKMKSLVGITTRNGRSPAPAILLEEADQALAQAVRGAQSPIIAFRSDADKFNNYMK